MASYLASWLGMGSSSSSSSNTGTTDSERDPDPPVSLRVSPPPDIVLEQDEDGSDTETEGESDVPPAFPALSSAQRLGGGGDKPASKSITNGNGIPKVLTDSTLMPPPPQPGLAFRNPGDSLRLPASSSASSSLAAPPTTTKRPDKPGSKKREKVALAPGHSPLDWASLKSSGQDLRGVDALARIPPSVLKEHRTREDAWTAINGKVYNITAYLPFHPGGEKELMRVAGRDGTKLFALTHAWVNAEFMLDACMVGFFVPEPAR